MYKRQVLTHALMDGMIGAMGLGDIGRWFPDTDDNFRGADSLKLLEEGAKIMKEKGFYLENVDCTIIAQQPKLSGYLDKRKENFARILQCEKQRINIKATTEEKLGFTGAEHGFAAHAAVSYTHLYRAAYLNCNRYGRYHSSTKRL